MATYDSVLVGTGNQSVDNITMYSSRGQRLMRRKATKVTNPKTDKQMRQRAKLALLVSLAQGFTDVYGVGFPDPKAGATSCNDFVAANMANVTVDDDYAATMDYERLACSADKKRKRPSVTVTFAADTYNFSQPAQDKFYGQAKPSDKVYAVLLEKALGESALVELKTRGEGGSTSFELPEGWDSAQVMAYAFAASADGKRTSATVNLPIGGGE